MKSDVETLNPTRVKLTVEVPFAELKPALDKAYRTISAQVAIPGFRKGKVPPRLIDQRVGRSAVLEEAVNDALPTLYGQAVTANDVKVIGQPEVEVTRLEDGDLLEFTAEVDIRPEFELPAYDAIEVTVPDAEATDDDVDQEIQSLRERFGTLRGVERPAAEGDFLSIDMIAMADGEEVDTATGLSYQVGSDTLLDGLDEAVRGTSAGESVIFSSELAAGEMAGKAAEVTVTVKSVKERDLPELDDEFAQLASEFDTLGELRGDVRARLERIGRLNQASTARDNVLAALLSSVDMHLPQGIVTAEIEGRQHNLAHELEQMGVSKEEYLSEEDVDEAEFDADVASHARDAVKAQFVLDEIAKKEEFGVTEGDLTQHIVRRASRVGMPPDEYAQQLVKAGQIQMLVAEVVRGKALGHVLERARITDESGRPVDLQALAGDDQQTIDSDAVPAVGTDAEADEDDDVFLSADADLDVDIDDDDTDIDDDLDDEEAGAEFTAEDLAPTADQLEQIEPIAQGRARDQDDAQQDRDPAPPNTPATGG